jgi:hypothetical protein
MRDTFIAYPLQNNIQKLPEEEMIACINGLVDGALLSFLAFAHDQALLLQLRATARASQSPNTSGNGFSKVRTCCGQNARQLSGCQTAFGKGLNDTFMIPYNFKVWATPAEKMNTEWMVCCFADCCVLTSLSDAGRARCDCGS